MAPTWREQYDRMRRWYARLSESTTDDDRRLDDFRAFFIVCFHLKDWLQADSSVDSKIRGEVEGFLASNLWLRLCADIANGSKHLVVQLNPRYDSQARVEKRPTTADPADVDTGDRATQRIIVALAEDAWSALDVAKKVVAAWDRFLTERGLERGGNG